MIEVAYYTIEDIKEILFSVKIGEFYETSQKFNGEYWTLRVKVLGLRDYKTVLVQKIRIKTNMNNNPREQECVGSRRQLMMYLPIEIFKKHFHAC
jgi:hypothetical protein